MQNSVRSEGNLGGSLCVANVKPEGGDIVTHSRPETVIFAYLKDNKQVALHGNALKLFPSPISLVLIHLRHSGKTWEFSEENIRTGNF